MNQKFIDFQINLHGKEKAQEWLDKIPKIVEELKSKWDLEIGEELELSYNYVISVRQSENPAVLKIFCPENTEYFSQLRSLKFFNGKGSSKVLESEDANLALLLEKCIPGTPLYDLNNETEETLIFTKICKTIWQKAPANSEFPNIEEELKDFRWYFKNYDKVKDSLGPDLVEKAEAKFKKLLKTQKELYVLHGDLHHYHILQSQRGWLTIDSRAKVGEREYDVGTFFKNPINRAEEGLVTKEVILKRIDIIVKELGLDRKRLIDWGFVQTVLSIVWNLESGKQVEYSIKIAKELEKL